MNRVPMETALLNLFRGSVDYKNATPTGKVETHDERIMREQKHLKKQTKKTSHKKGLLKPVKDKNYRNHLLEGVEPTGLEDFGDDD